MPESSTGIDIFISYASADRRHAFHVADLFEHEGFGVWLDRQSIEGGQSWSAAIVNGIKGCRAVLLLCSAASMSSPNVEQEVQLAWDYRRPILPLLLDRAPLPPPIEYALAGRQWVEVLDQPDADWFPRAVRALADLGATPRSRDVAPVSTPRHNLPAQTTPLIGRSGEIAAVAAILRRSDTRLVTLVGPGGTGKTRLALAVAVAVLEAFPDGVFFVDLAPLADPALVPSTIAQVLGVREASEQSLLDHIVAFLGDRRVLLVLDNFEHLLPAAPPLAQLLAAAPRVKVLITSRAVLRLSGEHEYLVPPLALPSRPPATPQEALDSSAIMLFVARAQQVRVDFALTSENASTIAAICRRLDGLPLAIELAAARVRLLPPQAILNRLDQQLKVLTGGLRDGPLRQRSLRSTIAWSYDLLDSDEQALFRRLAVFAGGATLEAIEAVCATNGSTNDVFDVLDSLIGKSLALQLADASTAPRFVMLEAIREYALDQLVVHNEAWMIKDRHTTFYSAMIAQVHQDLTGPQQQEIGQVLEREHDNLRAVLACALEQGNSESALRFATQMYSFWVRHGHFAEGRRWLLMALSKAGAAQPELRAHALRAAGALARSQGDLLAAQPLLEEALGIWRAIGDRDGMATGLSSLAMVMGQLDELEASVVLFEEALALRRELSDSQLVAHCLGNLGVTLALLGDYARAQTVQEECLVLLRERGDVGGAGHTLENLGCIYRELGKYSSALTFHRESLSIFWEIGDKRSIAISLDSLATLAAAQYQSERAAILWAAVEALRKAIHAPLPPPEHDMALQRRSTVRATLSEVRWEAAWLAGWRMPLQEIVAYALRDEMEARSVAWAM